MLQQRSRLFAILGVFLGLTNLLIRREFQLFDYLVIGIVGLVFLMSQGYAVVLEEDTSNLFARLIQLRPFLYLGSGVFIIIAGISAADFLLMANGGCYVAAWIELQRGN